MLSTFFTLEDTFVLLGDLGLGAGSRSALWGASLALEGHAWRESRARQFWNWVRSGLSVTTVARAPKPSEISQIPSISGVPSEHRLGCPW
jgi:hypothetical protein